MSRIEYGDSTWRIHDHFYDSDGRKILIFRRWGVENDYWIGAKEFHTRGNSSGKRKRKG